MRTFYSSALAASLLCVCAACSGRAAAPGTYAPPAFEHYQPILDRMPFGALPANFGQTPVDPGEAKNAAQAQAEQQKLAKQVNMSAVNVTPGGQTAIGFTDLNEKPPISYYLLVGASGGGWTVVSADYDDEIATLEKDGVTITLQLGKGLIDPAALAAKTAEKAAAPAPPTRPAPAAPAQAASHLTHGSTAARALGGHSVTTRTMPRLKLPSLATAPVPVTDADVAAEEDARSYKDRLLERKTQETQAQQAADKRQQEQLVKLAQEAARKAIARREEETARAAAEAEPLQQEEQPMAVPQEPLPAGQEGNVQ